MNTHKINVHCTSESFTSLLLHDEKLVGTPLYLGITYFWHHDFRHTMRDKSPYQRVRLHAKLLAAGLDPAGNSAAHAEILGA